MPVILDKAHILENPDQLRSQKWLAELINDLVYSPGMTQQALEENFRLLRECYQECSLDGIFTALFSRMAQMYSQSEDLQETGLTVRMPYTKHDFLYIEAPYREIAEQKAEFARDQVTAQLAEIAKSLGVTGFRQFCAKYDRGLSEQVAEGRHTRIPLTKQSTLLRLVRGIVLSSSLLHTNYHTRFNPKLQKVLPNLDALQQLPHQRRIKRRDRTQLGIDEAWQFLLQLHIRSASASIDWVSQRLMTVFRLCFNCFRYFSLFPTNNSANHG